MTGPDHYAEAERHIEYAHGCRDDGKTGDVAEHLLFAQVHATLATAAAIAFGGIPIATLADTALAAEWASATGVTP